MSEPSRPDPSVREDCQRGPRFVIKRRRLLKQQFWVVAVGGNGEPLSHSEMLSSKQACLTNIAAQRLLVDAPTEDQT
jgi:hypothetical protein